MFVVAEEQDLTCSFKSAIIFSKAQIIQHTHTRNFRIWTQSLFSVSTKNVGNGHTCIRQQLSKKKLFPVRPERLLRRRKSRKQKHWP